MNFYFATYSLSHGKKKPAKLSSVILLCLRDITLSTWQCSNRWAAL